MTHTTMKTITPLLTVIAMALLFGCGTAPRHHDFSGTPTTDIVVTVSCSDPGMKFAGTFNQSQKLQAQMARQQLQDRQGAGGQAPPS